MAAWVAVETFEGYSNSSDLNGANGGSGFSGAWSGTASKYFASTSQAYQGTVSARGPGANANLSRTLTTSVDSGFVYWAMRITGTPANGQDASLRFMTHSGVDFWAVIGWNNDGGTSVLRYLNSAASGWNTLLSGANYNQWYLFEMEIASNASYKLRYHDGASWSSQTAAQGSVNAANIDTITFNMSGSPVGSSPEVFWDYISPTNPITVPPVATNNRFMRQAVNRASTF